jgi:hypothetical protein
MLLEIILPKFIEGWLPEILAKHTSIPETTEDAGPSHKLAHPGSPLRKEGTIFS